MQVRLAKTSATTKLVGGRQPSGRGSFVRVADVEDAITACKTYVLEHGLTPETWTGGDLIDRTGALCGWIAVDGTLNKLRGFQRPRSADESKQPIDNWCLYNFKEKTNRSGQTAFAAFITLSGIPALALRNEGRGNVTKIVCVPVPMGWKSWDMHGMFLDHVREWLAGIGLQVKSDHHEPWVRWQTRELHLEESYEERLADFYRISKAS